MNLLDLVLRQLKHFLQDFPLFSKKLSFTIMCIGFSNKIVFRNKAKPNDDIYVTGNLGDSFVGLRILQKKIN